MIKNRLLKKIFGHTCLVVRNHWAQFIRFQIFATLSMSFMRDSEWKIVQAN